MWMCNMEITSNMILICFFQTAPTLFFNEIKPKLVQIVNKQETEVLQNMQPQNIYN